MSRNERPVCETETDIFAKRLRDAMSISNENQTSLAKKISEHFIPIQRQTISLYMSGQSKPDTERLAAICRVLDVPADFLLGFTDCCETSPGIRATVDYTGLDELSISNLTAWVKRGKDVANDLFDNRTFWNALEAWTEWVNSEKSLTHTGSLDEMKQQEIAAEIAWSRVRRAFDRLLSYNPNGATLLSRSPFEGRDLDHRLETYKQCEQKGEGE